MRPAHWRLHLGRSRGRGRGRVGVGAWRARSHPVEAEEEAQSLTSTRLPPRRSWKAKRTRRATAETIETGSQAKRGARPKEQRSATARWIAPMASQEESAEATQPTKTLVRVRVS